MNIDVQQSICIPGCLLGVDSLRDDSWGSGLHHVGLNHPYMMVENGVAISFRMSFKKEPCSHLVPGIRPVPPSSAHTSLLDVPELLLTHIQGVSA